MLRRRGVVALVLGGALVMAACASNTKTGTGGSTTTAGGASTTPTTSGPLTASFRGVTADSIKIGISLVDYKPIKDFIDFDRGDEQKTAQVFIDAINNAGGVGGRRLVPVFVKYLSVGTADLLKKCTQLTEDEKVFAVIGLVYDPTGQGPLCYSKQHQTVHIGFELREDWMNQSGGLMVTPSRSQDRGMRLLVQLLGSQKFWDTHKKAAILTDQNSDKLVTSALEPALRADNVSMGSKAVLSVTGTDTTAAQQQLDSFLERWKNENVDSLFLASATVASKQFVEKIKRVLPNVALIGAVDTGLEQAGKDEVAAKKNPNPYEGTYVAGGQTSADFWNTRQEYQDKCVKPWEAATGQKLTAPQDVKPINGKTDERWIAVDDFCTLLYMFKTIAEKAGSNLTNDTWKQAVNSFGKIDLVSTPFASLGQGKYDASDEVRLSQFSSTQGSTGGWKPVTDLVDASTLTNG